MLSCECCVCYSSYSYQTHPRCSFHLLYILNLATVRKTRCILPQKLFSRAPGIWGKAYVTFTLILSCFLLAYNPPLFSLQRCRVPLQTGPRSPIGVRRRLPSSLAKGSERDHRQGTVKRRGGYAASSLIGSMSRRATHAARTQNELAVRSIPAPTSGPSLQCSGLTTGYDCCGAL